MRVREDEPRLYSPKTDYDPALRIFSGFRVHKKCKGVDADEDEDEDRDKRLR